MADLTSRRDAFENKFAHDEMLRFKAVARRDKTDFEESGDEDVVSKILRDFGVAGHAITTMEVRRARSGHVQ